ncbi:MAG: DUF3368 domain-containing protein [Ignavibacteria bacterium]|nr:DUF3368 domain-containing protein [Ignavibacteria bacterium]
MHKVIIAYTSCIILFTNIGELDLLRKLYSEIIITPEISDEYGKPLPGWIIVKDVSDKPRQDILEIFIDKGEASAIALALETPGSTLVIDDYKARKIADKLNLSYTGTLGVIIKAKQDGIISSIKPFIEKIKQTNFRISQELECFALKAAGE